MSTTTINGKSAALPDDRDAMLVDVIRDGVGLTGTKLVCGSGVCGACTVLLDGAPVASCLLPAQAAAGKSVTTVEGIASGGLHPIQKACMAHDALQCGFCTPGFIVEATAFFDRWRAANGTAVPSREEIGAALSGHLCRCGAYEGIFNAVAAACAGQFDGRDIQPPRVEAGAKVTGAAKYTVDIKNVGPCRIRRRGARRIGRRIPVRRACTFRRQIDVVVLLQTGRRERDRRIRRRGIVRLTHRVVRIGARIAVRIVLRGRIVLRRRRRLRDRPARLVADRGRRPQIVGKAERA